MTTTQSSARRRELGDELRRARERTGLSGNQLAAQLGWQPSKLSRVERGLNRCAEVEAAMVLGFLRVEPDEVRRILALCQEEENDGAWLQSIGGRLPDQVRTLVLAESTATTISDLELNRIPGLLQTEDYARALIRRGGLIPEVGVEPRVGARLARQALLRRDNAPGCVFYIHEQALRLPVGKPDVMRDQMLHLLFVSSLPFTTIRIIPAEAGPHAGLDGPFRLMQYAEHHPMVYMEFHSRCLVLESPMDTVTHRLVLGKLAQQALSGSQSRSMLAALANDYDRTHAANGPLSNGELVEPPVEHRR